MKIVIITGQTATGKTAYAVELAKRMNGEIVNCDSRQIYKYLDIVTGKDKNITKDVKIDLYDIVDPKEYFSSFDYTKAAIPIIKKILNAGKIPIVVGGTYLYLKHLLYNIDTENIQPDWELRKKLAGKTINELQEILKKIDLQSINRLNESDINNPQRLIRKIEIAKRESGGTYLPAGRGRGGFNEIAIGQKLGIENIDVEFIGFYFKDRNELKKRITIRVKHRLEQGAIKEVQDLLKNGYAENDPGMRTIGCQQIVKFLQDKLNKEEMINEWINKEMQYGKRQYTFMKKDSNISWKIF